MEAILVAVDYTDILSITLPYNRHHFSKVLVVSCERNKEELEPLIKSTNSDLFITNAFYDDGAVFNKWKALEQGLDYLGRNPKWLCIMDADILWPKVVPEYEKDMGKLYTPYRYVMEDIVGLKESSIPLERDWDKFPMHRNLNEWPGYSQIFHTSDKALGKSPWHEIDWRHAGGADSFFQMKWQAKNKIRPPFHVLHLGPTGANWCGRTSEYLDGTVDEEASNRKIMLNTFMTARKVNKHNRFWFEKL